MTHTEVRAWVQANAERKMAEFGLPHWRIDFTYAAGGQDCEYKMRCRSYPDRERASIDISHDCYEDDETPETLEGDLEHELMHVVHSPFELARYMAHEFMPEDQFNAFASLFSSACEMTVRNMERMTHCLRKAAKPE
jgi:hypothetical protein